MSSFTQTSFITTNNGCGNAMTDNFQNIFTGGLTKYKIKNFWLFPHVSKVGLFSVLLIERGSKYYIIETETSKETGTPSEYFSEGLLDKCFELKLFSDSISGAIDILCNRTKKLLEGKQYE